MTQSSWFISSCVDGKRRMGTEPGCSYVESAACSQVESSIVLSRNSVLRRNWISGKVEPATNSTRSFWRTTRTSDTRDVVVLRQLRTDVEDLGPQLDLARLLLGITERGGLHAGRRGGA